MLGNFLLGVVKLTKNADFDKSLPDGSTQMVLLH